MKNFKKKQVLKHILYIILFLIAYVLQVTPRFFEVLGGKPFWLISLAVLVAMFEGEFVGGLYGAFAGLLCDAASFSLFGFNGFLLCIVCIGVGLLTVYLMQPHVGNALLLTAVGTLLIRSIQFLFTYGIFGYDGIWQIFMRQVIVTTALTLVTTFILFFPIRRLILKLQASQEG